MLSGRDTNRSSWLQVYPRRGDAESGKSSPRTTPAPSSERRVAAERSTGQQLGGESERECATSCAGLGSRR